MRPRRRQRRPGEELRLARGDLAVRLKIIWHFSCFIVIYNNFVAELDNFGHFYMIQNSNAFFPTNHALCCTQNIALTLPHLLCCRATVDSSILRRPSCKASVVTQCIQYNYLPEPSFSKAGPSSQVFSLQT